MHIGRWRNSALDWRTLSRMLDWRTLPHMSETGAAEGGSMTREDEFVWRTLHELWHREMHKSGIHEDSVSGKAIVEPWTIVLCPGCAKKGAASEKSE